MKKKKPRFFCDNCGYEVGSEVKACPYCGRFFASVRCPSCTYSGPDRMFQNGCPMCGYSTSSDSNEIVESKIKKKKYRPSAEPLPSWVLIAAFIGLGVVILLLTMLITL